MFKQIKLIKNLETAKFIKWLIGFIEGEGCFCITYNSNKNTKNKKPQIRAVFQIGLAESDKDILYKIQKELEMGRIYHQQAISINGTLCKKATLQITKKQDLIILIRILDKFTFYTKKKKDYEIWKQCVGLINSQKHISYNHMNYILTLRKKMNLRENKNV